MTVTQLLNEMPYEELCNWIAFFERKPFGWREDLRTGYLMNAMGVKKKASEIFGSIAAMNRPSSFKESGLFSLLLTAKGGQQVLQHVKDDIEQIS